MCNFESNPSSSKKVLEQCGQIEISITETKWPLKLKNGLPKFEKVYIVSIQAYLFPFIMEKFI